MGQTARGTSVVELLLRRFGRHKAALAGLRDDTSHAIDKGTDRTDGRGGTQPLEHGETPAGLPQADSRGGDPLSGQGRPQGVQGETLHPPGHSPLLRVGRRDEGLRPLHLGVSAARGKTIIYEYLIKIWL